jgi:hypothetical protein
VGIEDMANTRNMSHGIFFVFKVSKAGCYRHCIMYSTGREAHLQIN